jgi:hypothetical protein
MEAPSGGSIAELGLASAYQAMDLKKPNRMRRPRAAASRMAQVSVESLREGRVLRVAMVELLEESAVPTKKRVAAAVMNF